MHNEKMVALIIPFYNEKIRFRFDHLEDLAQRGYGFLEIFLIDDGSEDNLFSDLEVFISVNSLNNVKVFRLEENLGKANAIRSAIMSINSDMYGHIAFTDSDFSTEPEEIIRVIQIAWKENTNLVYGSRIQDETNDIRTSRFRRIQGKTFNLITKRLFRIQLEDSQCGLKCFPQRIHNKNFVSFCEEKFRNQWLIDLEITFRILQAEDTQIVQVRLNRWVHRKASKTSILDTIEILRSLLWLKQRYKSSNRLLVRESR